MRARTHTHTHSLTYTHTHAHKKKREKREKLIPAWIGYFGDTSGGYSNYHKFQIAEGKPIIMTMKTVK